jgi:uncharacterized membrane protein YphA (DoxX/SURF4 family)
MQIEHPMFLFLVFIIFGSRWIEAKVKSGTIIVSSIRFAKQANREIGYKRRNWLSKLRLCSMVLIVFILCEISIGNMIISPFLTKLAAISLVGEIFLKNTVLRILP